jgi:hypothetical protein
MTMFKNFDDVQKFSKDQMEVATKAATTVSEGVKALATEATEFSKKSFEDLTATSEALRGAKTFEAAVKIQQDYAKSAYEAFVAQATKVSEVYTNLAKEAFKPVEGFVAKVQDVVKTAA